jgi:hypothetical protein
MTNKPVNFAQAYSDLQYRIDQAYAVFARYERPRSLHASSVHDQAKIFRDLTSAPLRELDLAVLDGYARSAMTTIGDPEDYKHFLPRILELAATSGREAEDIAGKLDYAGWRTWPAAEQAAIDDVFQAAWAKARLMHPDEEDASGWLCGIAMLGLDLETALDGWLESMTPASALQLATFLTGQEDLPKGGGYWAEVDIARRRLVVDWLCGDAVQIAFIDAVDHVAESDRWLFDSADTSVALLLQAHWR